ncbi:MAG: hypothetical protein Kow0080_11580 [Candidatus Promineifilaceae bacterium]
MTLLREELHTEQVSHLDLSGFTRVTNGMTVAACIEKMQQENHNVALVLDDQNKLVGIFTERDVLRKVADQPEMLAQPIDKAMTPNPVTVTPESSAADALWLMDSKHIRNLPVVSSNGAILGAMTHQSVINFLAAHYPQEILNRPPDSDRFPRKQEGG